MKVNEDRAAYNAQREVERLRRRVRDLEAGLEGAIWALENVTTMTMGEKVVRITKLKLLLPRGD